jgi:Fic family protein
VGVNTLIQFSKPRLTIPTATAWYLGDLGEALGKQQLFTKQSPQRLNALREHALIESAVSSNRIEGVEVDHKRIGTVLFGRPVLRDRSEEEVRGYRRALDMIHSEGRKLQVSEKLIRQLHELIRGDVWDAGKYKDKDGDIIERYGDGRSRVRFSPTSAAATPAAMAELVAAWTSCHREKWVPPLIALAAFNLDFLCVHPFRDGNGRVSRLLLLLQCYQLGMEVGKYISIERLIEQNKVRYYETLEHCSRGWHGGTHDPWPFINHILFVLKQAYHEFEQRVGQTTEPKGTKAQLVRGAVAGQAGEFRVTDIERACPGVGREWIRAVLAQMRKAGEVRCQGRGPAARWRKIRSKHTTL